MQKIGVSVLGAGSWGTALAALASKQAKTVLWSRDLAQAQQIQNTKENKKYLPNIKLPDTLICTNDIQLALANALENKGLIILGVPMVGLVDICSQLAELLPNQAKDLHILWTCKGIHPETHAWPHEIINKYLPSHDWLHTGVISGPSFAREVAQGLPVALTVASNKPSTGQIAQDALHGHQARIYSSNDIIGVEVGGAMKNVIAIACGISDGLKLGTNARAALITRGLAEIKRMGMAVGGQADTFIGLTGLGDLVLTATGDLSRNRQVGVALGQGKTLTEILSSGMTAEGVRCANAASSIAQNHHLDLPIIKAVCDILDGSDAKEIVQDLLSRNPRAE